MGRPELTLFMFSSSLVYSSRTSCSRGETWGLSFRRRGLLSKVVVSSASAGEVLGGIFDGEEGAL